MYVCMYVHKHTHTHIYIYIYIWSRDGAVSIANCYGLNGPGIESSLLRDTEEGSCDELSNSECS